ncbi:DUF6920 family protein [Kangiella sediminilitoris]|uniref:Uncharacterized protein n=1 Tax=Kangiella sediminilitoris TaxID=1144748 RepID=A0A1B3B7L3_9GAMM|nr:DUF6544 family protein [Kangiella sediminilitoris]AOE48782.1 hypothetical protein KS2013_50 [Kangiella sediminilitoris]
MEKWLLVIAVIIAVIIVVLFMGYLREQKRIDNTLERLKKNSVDTNRVVSFSSLDNLPAPVKRYFKRVLTDGQKIIKTAILTQDGVVRTSTESEKWFPFSAKHSANGFSPGFLWNAKLKTPLATHIRVTDGYFNGVGSGRVSLLSSLLIGYEENIPELNTGALHRYLAESVWYPTALLPESGVEWSAIDDKAALATLRDQGATVSLEFHFNSSGEATGIYTPGRYRKEQNKYVKTPWEGHFKNYKKVDGMRVPCYGEVGWYSEDQLKLVWKGNITDFNYKFYD